MCHRGTEAVGEPSLQPLAAFDLDPGLLEAASRRITSRTRRVKTLAGTLGSVRECSVRLGRGLTPPERLFQAPAGELEARPRGAPFFMREAASQLGEALAHRPELDRGHGLVAQLGQPGRRVLEQVRQAPNDDVGAIEPVRGLFARSPKGSDTGRLLDQRPALSWGGLDDPVDVVLHDDRVAVLGQSGAAEQALQVAKPGVVAVDPELGVAVTASDPAAHRDLGILRGQRALLVVDNQLHLCESHPLAAAAAGVDDLVHALPAQLASVGLAERPAHRIDQVALTAPVRPDDGGNPRVEEHLAARSERLEPGQGDPPEPHRGDCPRAGRETSTSWARVISEPQDLVLTP